WVCSFSVSIASPDPHEKPNPCNGLANSLRWLELSRYPRETDGCTRVLADGHDLAPELSVSLRADQARFRRSSAPDYRSEQNRWAVGNCTCGLDGNSR